MTTLYRMLNLKYWWAVAAMLPALWALGHLAPAVSYSAGVFHAGVLQNDVVQTILVLQATAIVTALVVGFVAAFVARALGHQAIRTLITPSQSLIAAGLATAALWVAVTGLNWAAYRQDELLTQIWYVLTGATQGLFGAVWLLLAVRAASSLRQFNSALNLFAAAEGCFLSALGGFLLLFVILDGSQPDPSLTLFGLILLLSIALIAVPPALALTAGAALWGGILAARETHSGPGAGGAPLPPDA